jgi:CO/xanthine dehydrogenase Mo-binding subunit
MARKLTQVGKPATRLDGQAKVSGALRYAADVELAGMLWGKCLRSPYPHARIRSVDITAARNITGVFAVLTADDLPRRLVGRRLKDMPVLARDTVRFIGERVAVVAAATPAIAEEATHRIQVDYEELKAVHHPLEAMRPDAPILHENLSSYEILRLPLPDIPNVHSHVQSVSGNLDQGFRESDLIFEQTFSTPRVHHGYLEPHAVVVDIDAAGKILVWCPAKGPYVTRSHLAEWLGLPEEKIIFQISPVGGDFGGKASLMDIPLCYSLAKVTGKPVKMIMSYAEELIAANPRHPALITIKSGVKKDGRLWAREVRAIFNSGAYAGFKNSDNVNLPGARHGAGAYFIPHLKIDAYSVYTNCVPSGIMRAPGEAQMLFAVESHIDYLAAQLKMDAVEFRHRNLLKRGDRLPYGVKLEDDKARQLLKRVAARIGWNRAKKKQPYVGRGLAFCIREIGIGEANVEIGLKNDGRVYLVTTVPDTGTGAHTIFRQLAAEILCVNADEIEIVMGTTDHFPTDVAVAASRVTYLAGQACSKAAVELRELLKKEVAAHFDCPAAAVRCDGICFRAGKKENISFSQLAALASSAGRTLRVKANFQMHERGGTACFFAQAAKIKVDPQTGTVRILRMFSAHDTGTVINPLTFQGQVEGGMVQGLGFALMENLRDDDGKIVTASLGEYKIPNITDVPPLDTLLFQDRDGPGPFQSKPVGEHSAVPTAPAIANAIYDAIGIQLTDLPLGAEAVYAALKSATAARAGETSGRISRPVLRQRRQPRTAR